MGWHIVFYKQANFDIRCEWGKEGIEKLSTISDVAIVVDVLSFSTCVDIAVSNGALVFPYRWKDDTAIQYAKFRNAELANSNRRVSVGFSLSPASLINLTANTRIVLPSPNGSTLSLLSKSKYTLTGCLRNSLAVAEYAQNIGKTVTVIPAGERWNNGTLRPAIEDLIGAGAIINSLAGTKSPEAEVARSAFQAVGDRLLPALLNCSSRKEFDERGFKLDVELAAQLNSSNAVPKLRDDAYLNCNSA